MEETREIDEYQEIIEELLRQTRTRKIEWTPSSINNQFTISLGDGSITIDYYDEEDRDEEEDPIYRVIFYNQRGESIVSLSIWNATDPDYALFSNLWKEIIDKYYLKKETLASIRQSLGMEK